jgi:uncharacterized OB-fold protein
MYCKHCGKLLKTKNQLCLNCFRVINPEVEKLKNETEKIAEVYLRTLLEKPIILTKGLVKRRFKEVKG